jgi:hypothetical protein
MDEYVDLCKAALNANDRRSSEWVSVQISMLIDRLKADIWKHRKMNSPYLTRLLNLQLTRLRKLQCQLRARIPPPQPEEPMDWEISI